jgi:hypothetical protein
MRAKPKTMPIAHDLLSFSALILAGIAGALLAKPVSGAVRVVAERVRIDDRRR